VPFLTTSLGGANGSLTILAIAFPFRLCTYSNHDAIFRKSIIRKVEDGRRNVAMSVWHEMTVLSLSRSNPIGKPVTRKFRRSIPVGGVAPRTSPPAYRKFRSKTSPTAACSLELKDFIAKIYHARSIRRPNWHDSKQNERGQPFCGWNTAIFSRSVSEERAIISLAFEAQRSPEKTRGFKNTQAILPPPNSISGVLWAADLPLNEKRGLERGPQEV
jgi:hypothetical protein